MQNFPKGEASVGAAEEFQSQLIEKLKSSLYQNEEQKQMINKDRSINAVQRVMKGLTTPKIIKQAYKSQPEQADLKAQQIMILSKVV